MSAKGIEERTMVTRKKDLGPVHPGEILREEFLSPLSLSSYALAGALRVPRTRIERLVREETPVTADTALRLARYFGTTAEFWLGIQARLDVETARQSRRGDISAIRPRKMANPCQPPVADRQNREVRMKMDFIELHIDLQRNPELLTKRVIVSTRHILKIEPRKTIDKDGGATVTLSGSVALSVVESYESLKKKLQA